MVFIYLFINIYLFIIYLVVLGISCSRWAPSLWLTGSLVVACKLLAAACMWELVPRRGIKPGPLALGVRCLNHCATKEVPGFFFNVNFLALPIERAQEHSYLSSNEHT